MPGAQNGQRREKKSVGGSEFPPGESCSYTEQAPPGLHVGSGWDRGLVSDKEPPGSPSNN